MAMSVLPDTTASIPLDEAMVCLTCDLVFAGVVCPRCADRFNWPLSRWLARAETAAEASYRMVGTNHGT